MALVEEIAQAKASVVSSRDDLLRQLSAVPDDRLGWSPAETARSPLWMVAHCGSANEAFAQLIRGETPSFPGDPQEVADMIRQAGRDAKTREEAVESVESSVEAVLASLDGLTETSIEGMVQSPFGPTPIRFWVGVPAMHMTGHARQLDYLQTVWGDLQDHR